MIALRELNTKDSDVERWVEGSGALHCVMVACLRIGVPVECFFEDEKGPRRFFTADGPIFLKLSAAPDLGMFRRYMYRREMAGFIRDEILEQHNFGRLQVRTSFFHDMDIEISGI